MPSSYKISLKLIWDDVYLKMIASYVGTKTKGQFSLPSGVNFRSD